MLTIIKIEADEQGRHEIQSQSHRTACWEEGYIAVPSHLEAKVWESLGWCDLTIEDGALTGITPRERPAPEPEEETETERLRAQVAALQAQVLELRLG